MKIYNKESEHLSQLIIVKCDKCKVCYELEKVEIDNITSVEITCDCENIIYIPAKVILLFTTLYNNLSNEYSEIVEKLNIKKKKIERIIFAHNKMINIITEK